MTTVQSARTTIPNTARMPARPTALALAVGLAAGLAATAPMAPAQSTIEWATPVDGDFAVAENWSPMMVPGAMDTAVLGGGGAYVVSTSSRAVGFFDLANPNAVLAVTPGTLTIGGALGPGTIVVNRDQSSSNSDLILGGGAEVGSPIVLNAAPGADLRDAIAYWSESGAVPLITEDGSLSGRGRWYYALLNDGVIESVGTDGYVQFVEALVTQGAGGVVRSVDGGTIGLFGGSVVTGGTWDGSDGRLAGGGTIGDATITGTWGIESGSTVNLAGAIGGDGTIVVNRTQGTSDSDLRLGDGAQVGIPVALNAAPGASLRDAAAYWSRSGAVPRITEDGSLSGRGQWYYALLNDGVIEAVGSDGYIQFVDGTVTQGAGGVVRSVDGGTIGMSSATVTGGTWDGGDDGRMASGTIGDATITGTWGIESGSTVNLAGAIGGDGTIVVNRTQGTDRTDLVLRDGAEVGIPIVLNTSPDSTDLLDAVVYWWGSAAEPRITADGSLSGRGAWYYGLLNDGVIESVGTDGYIRFVDASITQGAGAVVRSVDGGTIGLSSSVVTGGTWDGGIDGRLLGRGTIGDATIAGTWGIEAGNIVDLAGVIGGDGTIVVNRTQGTDRTDLVLRDGAEVGIPIVLNTSPDSTDLLDAVVYSSGSGAVARITEEGSLSGRGRWYYALEVAGTLSPGVGADGIGLLEPISAAITLTPTARIAIDAGGTADDAYDRIAGTGTITLDGALSVNFVDGYVPEPTDRFEIIRATTINGSFTDIDIEPVGGVGGVGPAHVVYTRNSVIVVICAADCDGDGELSFFDFLCFQNLFAAGDPGADCDGDETLTFFDFLCFQNAFAAGCE